MTDIVDKRNTGKAPANADRKKFLDRYKRYVKDSIDRTIENSKIKDIKDKRKVTVPVDSLDEPHFTRHKDSGTRRYVLTGNTKFKKGAIIDKPKGGQGDGRPKASDDPEKGEDAFEFELTKEEFLDILFEDMSLPNYVKKSMKKDFKTKRVRAGYTSTGIVPQINLKKTFEKSLARRVAAKGALQARIDAAETEEEKEALRKKKPPFLEEVDLRYNHYAERKYPVRHAVMFCLMDVSASMHEEQKDIAKRFFLLLYLFLERQYKNVDIRFIRHTTDAEEVDEHTFFYDKVMGGTLVSTAFCCMKEIIDNDYDVGSTNIYVAQASDGDNFPQDYDDLINVLSNEILPITQYMAYLEVPHRHRMPGRDFSTEVWWAYENLTKAFKNLHRASASSKEEVFPVLRGLFRDE